MQHVRVKFIADAEEADIYKLRDIMYTDDTEVTSFNELKPGVEVIAKWPMNGKMYTAVVIDPIDTAGKFSYCWTKCNVLNFLRIYKTCMKRNDYDIITLLSYAVIPLQFAVYHG